MLGRLEMNIDECIEVYQELSRVVFKPTRHFALSLTGTVQARCDTSALETEIKNIVREKTGSEDTLMRNDDPEKCKVYWCNLEYCSNISLTILSGLFAH